MVDFKRDDFISSITQASLYDTEYKVPLYGREVPGVTAATGFGLIITLAYLVLVIIWILLGLRG